MTREDEEESDSIPLSDLRSDLEDDDPDRKGTPNEESETPPENSGERDSPKDKSSETETENDSPRSIPLSGLRDEVDQNSREKSAREETVARGAFVEENVDPVDSEGVWADLLMEDENPEGRFEAAETEEGAEGTTQVISKRICERCRYLDPPPTLTCTHEGTTIHELSDVDHVRVSACPMVGPDGEKIAKGTHID